MQKKKKKSRLDGQIDRIEQVEDQIISISDSMIEFHEDYKRAETLITESNNILVETKTNIMLLKKLINKAKILKDENEATEEELSKREDKLKKKEKWIYDKTKDLNALIAKGVNEKTQTLKKEVELKKHELERHYNDIEHELRSKYKYILCYCLTLTVMMAVKSDLIIGDFLKFIKSIISIMKFIYILLFKIFSLIDAKYNMIVSLFNIYITTVIIIVFMGCLTFMIIGMVCGLLSDHISINRNRIIKTMLFMNIVFLTFSEFLTLLHINTFALYLFLMISIIIVHSIKKRDDNNSRVLYDKDIAKH